MLQRHYKKLFYALTGPVMRINGWRHRVFAFRSPAVPKWVHLGPGQQRYLPGWINVDANMFTAQCDIWGDLSNKLPFKDKSVDVFYSHHVIEHLPNLASHFQDVFRALKPGGLYRVGGPNGDEAILKFTMGDHRWFSDYPDSRTSIGGRFENFIFCRQEHLTILTYSFLEELLLQAGFELIEQKLPVKETSHPEVFSQCLAIEHETDFVHPHTLVVECRKPA